MQFPARPIRISVIWPDDKFSIWTGRISGIRSYIFRIYPAGYQDSVISSTTTGYPDNLISNPFHYPPLEVNTAFFRKPKDENLFERFAAGSKAQLLELFLGCNIIWQLIIHLIFYSCIKSRFFLNDKYKLRIHLLLDFSSSLSGGFRLCHIDE